MTLGWHCISIVIDLPQMLLFVGLPSCLRTFQHPKKIKIAIIIALCILTVVTFLFFQSLAADQLLKLMSTVDPK